MEQRFSEESAAASLYEPPVALPVQQDEATATTGQNTFSSSPSTELLLAILERNHRHLLRRNKICQHIIGASSLIGIFIFFILRIAGLKVSIGLVYLPSGFMMFAGWLVGALALDKRAAKELARLDDLRCIEPLVDVWASQGQTVGYNRAICKQAKQALVRLLPRLKVSDAALLKEPQRAELRSVLANGDQSFSGVNYDGDFIVAILKGFAQIGDWKSEPMVRNLARIATQEKVREAARECLPYLEPLAEKQRVGEELLRASSADATDAKRDELLRPVVCVTEAPHETLLRAATGTNQNEV